MRSCTSYRAMLAAALLFCCAASAWTAELVLTNGIRVKGTISKEDAGGFDVDIGGAQMHFDRAKVYTVSDQGRQLDYDWATARSQGDWTKAGRLIMGAMLSDSWLRWTTPALGTLMGLMTRSHLHDQFASDVIIEADAEVAFDTRTVLPHIETPVLLIGGDKDYYFPLPLVQETARLSPDCTLTIYEGKGHLGACMSRQLAPDILNFIRTKQTVNA